MPSIAATLSLNVPAITALCKGEPGKSLLYGNTTPPPSISGSDGDFYLLLPDYVIFGPKSGGAWPSIGATLSDSASANIWNQEYTIVRSNSGRWNSSYTTLCSNSGRWNTLYTYINQSSGNSVIIQNLTGLWDSTYRTVSSLSGTWGTTAGVTQIVAGTNVTISPAGGTGVVTINAAGGGGGGGTGADIPLRSVSGFFISTYGTVSSLSANWERASRGVDLSVQPNSAAWSNSYTTSNTYSASWLSASFGVTHVQQSSAAWQNSYTVTNLLSSEVLTMWTMLTSTSGNWQNNIENTTFLLNASAEWDSVYDSVRAMSGDWEASYNTVFSAISVVPNLAPMVSAYEMWTDGSRLALTKEGAWDLALELAVGMALTGATGNFPRYIGAGAGGPLPISAVGSGFTFLIPKETIDKTIGINATSTHHVTANIPHAADQPADEFPVGSEIKLLQMGTARVYISAGQGVSLNSELNHRRTRDRYNAFTIIKTQHSPSIQWVAYGQMAL